MGNFYEQIFIGDSLKKSTSIRLLWFGLITIVPFLTLWELLFHPGLYAYSDQHFPLSTTLPPSGIVSSSVSGGFDFDRLIISWPYYVISAFTNSIGLRTRGFLLYTFLLFSFLCYTFAYVAVEFYSKHISTLQYKSKQFLKVPIFIVSYSNLSALNLNADGGTWSDSVILILIAISLFIILENNGQFNRYLMVSGFMILTFLLDPDYAPMFIIAILAISLTSGLSNKNLKRSLSYSLISTSFAILPLTFLYFQSSFISPLSVSGFGTLGFRAFTPTNVSFFSRNINLYNVFFLLGHSWSTLTYAPPAILWIGSSISFLPSLYNPAQVILTGNSISYAWLFSLAVLPLLALSSIYFKVSRKIAMQIVPLVVIAYVIIEEWNFIFVYQTLSYLSNIPFVGNSIGTSLTLPGHFINFLAFLYLPLFSLGICSLHHYLNKFNTNEKEYYKIEERKVQGNHNAVQSSSKISKKSIAAVVIVTFLVTLAGWQAFNGSIYPMRPYPGSYLVGNGVEPKGSFTPTPVSPSVIGAYNLVTADYSQSNLSSEYNTIWIGGPNANDFPYMLPPLTVSIAGLKDLVGNNLYSDTFPYLISHGIRYVVVSNEDIQSNVTNPFNQYGFSSYNQANIFFKNSGLKEIYNANETTVFLTSDMVNIFYKSNLLLNTTGSDILSPSLYGLFKSLGYNASFTDLGNPTGFNNNSKLIDIVTPALVPLSHILNLSGEKLNYTIDQGEYKYLNSSEYQGNLGYYQNHSLGQYNNYLPGNLTTTAWGGNTTFSYHNGNITTSSANASVSIDYNGPLAGQVGGVKILNPASPISMKLKFSVSRSTNFSGNSYVTILGESSNVSVTTFFQSHPFNVSNKTHEVNILANIPAGTTYVGFRIGFYTFSGQVAVNNINFSISSPYGDSYVPFGSYLNVSNVSFTVPAGFSNGYVLLSNSTNSSFNKQYVVSLGEYEKLNLTGHILGVVLVKNTALSGSARNYVVINTIVTNSYIIKNGAKDIHSFYQGKDGSYIFSVSRYSQLKVIYNHAFSNILLLGYVFIVIALLFLTLFPANKIYWKIHGNRKSKNRFHFFK